MEHHSQRSKRPPSRTLAPRILAALTAGAVTLGAFRTRTPMTLTMSSYPASQRI